MGVCIQLINCVGRVVTVVWSFCRNCGGWISVGSAFKSSEAATVRTTAQSCSYHLISLFGVCVAIDVGNFYGSTIE